MAKKLKIVTCSALIVAASLAAGCGANLYTVDRATRIPLSNERIGMAVHLDAQQRVVLSTAKGFCAEPSPDAFSAYAASLGLGATTPNDDSVSLANALQSMAGNLGLRTQSITLMRDALYRMCEAANNNELAPWEVAAFLQRSLNLTAVILAIEQLTGVVAANQIALAPEARAGASASALANQQLLDEAEERVKAAQGRVNSAEDRLNDLKEQAAKETSEGIESAQSSALKAAEDDLGFARQLLQYAVEIRDRIKESRDAALTDVRSETVSSMEITPVTQPRSLSPEATREIAKAVENMVKKVLDKDYSDEMCLSYLTAMSHRLDPTRRVSGLVEFIDTLSLCRHILTSGTMPGGASTQATGPDNREGRQLTEPLQPKEE